MYAPWFWVNHREILFGFHCFIIFEEILRFQNLKLLLPVSKCFKKVPLFHSFLIYTSLRNLSWSYKRFGLLLKDIRLEIVSRPRLKLVPIIQLLGLVRLIRVMVKHFVLFKIWIRIFKVLTNKIFLSSC